MLRFYITLQSKTMPHTRTYFPSLTTTCLQYAPLCPLQALRDVAEKGWVGNGFLRNATGKTLVRYLQQLIETKSAVSAYELSANNYSKWCYQQKKKRYYLYNNYTSFKWFWRIKKEGRYLSIYSWLFKKNLQKLPKIRTFFWFSY